MIKNAILIQMRDLNVYIQRNEALSKFISQTKIKEEYVIKKAAVVFIF